MGMRGSLRIQGLIVVLLRSNRQHLPHLIPSHCLQADTHIYLTATTAARLSVLCSVSSYPSLQANSSPFCGQIDVLLVSYYIFSIPKRARRSSLAKASPLRTLSGLYPRDPNTQPHHSFRHGAPVLSGYIRDHLLV